MFLSVALKAILNYVNYIWRFCLYFCGLPTGSLGLASPPRTGIFPCKNSCSSKGTVSSGLSPSFSGSSKTHHPVDVIIYILIVFKSYWTWRALCDIVRNCLTYPLAFPILANVSLQLSFSFRQLPPIQVYFHPYLSVTKVNTGNNFDLIF